MGKWINTVLSERSLEKVFCFTQVLFVQLLACEFKGWLQVRRSCVQTLILSHFS